MAKNHSKDQLQIQASQALTPAEPAKSFDIEALIKLAIESKTDVSALERLLAMRKELKAEVAKENFFIALSAFQSECPEIKKDHEVKNNQGKLLYSYAPIESIVAQVKQLLNKHGFSYTMEMQMTDKGVKSICKVIHRDGHHEVYSTEFPLGAKTGAMNESQVVAAATTFANRYVFKNAFGIMTGEDDTDGKPLPAEAEILAETDSGVPTGASHSAFDPATEKVGFGKKYHDTLWKDAPVDFLNWVLKQENLKRYHVQATETLEYLEQQKNTGDLPESVRHDIIIFEDPATLELYAEGSKWRYNPEFVACYNKKMAELKGQPQTDDLPF